MSVEYKQTENKLHSITIKNRQGAQLEGILSATRFDENEVLLETVCGTLSIDGEGLHLSEWNADQGSATLEGRIDAITYFDKKQNDAKMHQELFGKLLNNR